MTPEQAEFAASVTFDDRGLVPVVVQDAPSGEVLMLAYMNSDALERTLMTGRATYWSRSRGEIWVKGATSGNSQQVTGLALDCDRDTILMAVEQVGGACHTGDRTCFERVQVSVATA